MSVDVRYDMMLQRWVHEPSASRLESLEPHSDEKLYRRIGELRIERYLLSIEQLQQFVDTPHHLLEIVDGNTYDDYGLIVGFIPEHHIFTDQRVAGYWIVKEREEINIILGNSYRKPIALDT